MEVAPYLDRLYVERSPRISDRVDVSVDVRLPPGIDLALKNRMIVRIAGALNRGNEVHIDAGQRYTDRNVLKPRGVAGMT